MQPVCRSFAPAKVEPGPASSPNASATGIPTSPVTLMGEDLQYASCGICVSLLTDYNDLTGYTDWYLATSTSDR